MEEKEMGREQMWDLGLWRDNLEVGYDLRCEQME